MRRFLVLIIISIWLFTLNACQSNATESEKKVLIKKEPNAVMENQLKDLKTAKKELNEALKAIELENN